MPKQARKHTVLIELLLCYEHASAVLNHEPHEAQLPAPKTGIGSGLWITYRGFSKIGNRSRTLK